MNLVKEEPLIIGGILSGVGVFLGIRYIGVDVNGASQVFPGVSVAALMSFLSRFVGPSATQDVQGIANDVASLREQIGPLPKTGGLGGVAKWLAQLAEGHGKNLEAIVAAAKVDIEDLLHQPTVSVAKPTATIGGSMLTIIQDPASKSGASVPMTVSEAPTPVPEPASQAQLDAVAELAKLVP